WKGNADLELARQIGWAVNWLYFPGIFGFFRLFDGLDLFAIDPDFVIGCAAWSKVHCDIVRNLLHFCLGTRRRWRGTGHDISVHIATSGQRGEQRLIDAVNRAMQIAFEHAMQLNPLTCRDAYGAVAITIPQFIFD